MKSKLLLCIAILFSTILHAQNNSVSSPDTSGYHLPDYRKLSDIRYGKTDPNEEMDAYIPREYDSAKVIIYIHGGGWSGGDKSADLPAMVIENWLRKGNIFWCP